MVVEHGEGLLYLATLVGTESLQSISNSKHILFNVNAQVSWYIFSGVITPRRDTKQDDTRLNHT